MLGARQDAGIGVVRREIARAADEIGEDHQRDHDAKQRQGPEINAEDGLECVQAPGPPENVSRPYRAAGAAMLPRSATEVKAEKRAACAALLLSRFAKTADAAA